MPPSKSQSSENSSRQNSIQLEDPNEFPSLQDSQQQSQQRKGNGSNNKKMKELEQQLDVLKKKNDTLEKELIQVRSSNKSMTEIKEKYGDLKKNYEKIKTALPDANKIDEYKQDLENFKQENQQLKDENAKNKNMIAEYSNRCQTLEKELLKISSRYDEMSIKKQEIEKEEEQSNSALADSQLEISRLKNLLKEKEERFLTESKFTETIDEKHTIDKQKLVEEHQSEVNQLKAQIYKLTKKNSELEKKLQDENEELSRSREIIEQKNTAIGELKSERHTQHQHVPKPKDEDMFAINKSLEENIKTLEKKLHDKTEEANTFAHKFEVLNNELIKLKKDVAKSSQNIIPTSTSQSLKKDQYIPSNILYAAGGIGVGFILTKLFFSRRR